MVVVKQTVNDITHIMIPNLSYVSLSVVLIAWTEEQIILNDQTT